MYYVCSVDLPNKCTTTTSQSISWTYFELQLIALRGTPNTHILLFFGKPKHKLDLYKIPII